MARPLRIHAPGLLYHIITRGNHRQTIFLEDQDYRAFLHRLNEVWSDLPFRIYAYVLMSNHVHMLVEAGSIPLSRIMQNLLQRYTQYFNLKYNQPGHLFQDRFKSIICDRKEYLLELVRYIHLNPVRAKIVQKPDEYPWSSHGSYLSKKADAWLDRDAILMQFGKQVESAKKQYENFVLAAINEGHREDLYELKEQTVLGSDDFVKTLSLGALGDESENEELIPLEEIEKKICKKLKISSSEIRIPRNLEFSKARGIFCVASLKAGHQMSKVAAHLGYGIAAISQLYKRTKEKLGSDLNLLT